jgi:general stress protein 26
MEQDQRNRLKQLIAEEQVAVFVTQGEQWPTATMQAFAETPDLDLLFIMVDSSDKFQNLLTHPNVTVLIDARDKGKVATFEITRATFNGIAQEVARDGAEWEPLKAMFLKKLPFEAPFFNYPTLRMVRIKLKRVSYTGADRVAFKSEF